MSSRTLVIVPASTAADVDAAIDLCEEAAAWLASRGINQWRPGDLRAQRAGFTRRAEQGELFLGRLDRLPVATMIVQWSDPMFWGDQPPEAGYVHRLAVRRAHAGRGLGLAMLRWAEAHVARAGRAFVRLDCWGGNERLCRFYDDAGFVRRERKLVRAGGHEWDVQLFEKPVTAP